MKTGKETRHQSEKNMVGAMSLRAACREPSAFSTAHTTARLQAARSEIPEKIILDS